MLFEHKNMIEPYMHSIPSENFMDVISFRPEGSPGLQ